MEGIKAPLPALFSTVQLILFSAAHTPCQGGDHAAISPANQSRPEALELSVSVALHMPVLHLASRTCCPHSWLPGMYVCMDVWMYVWMDVCMKKLTVLLHRGGGGGGGGGEGKEKEGEGGKKRRKRGERGGAKGKKENFVTTIGLIKPSLTGHSQLVSNWTVQTMSH